MFGLRHVVIASQFPLSAPEAKGIASADRADQPLQAQELYLNLAER
jgi:hypothetical protein